MVPMPACPICKSAAQPAETNRAAPFCSERCKLIDLGSWLGEGYRIPEGAPPVRPPAPANAERKRNRRSA